MLKPFLIFILLISAYCVNCDENEQSNDDVFDDSIKEENVVSFYFLIKKMVIFKYFDGKQWRRNGDGWFIEI